MRRGEWVEERTCGVRREWIGHWCFSSWGWGSRNRVGLGVERVCMVRFGMRILECLGLMQHEATKHALNRRSVLAPSFACDCKISCCIDFGCHPWSTRQYSLSTCSHKVPIQRRHLPILKTCQSPNVIEMEAPHEHCNLVPSSTPLHVAIGRVAMTRIYP